MKLSQTLSILLTSTALLGACSVVKPANYDGHGQPEALLEQSSEIVNFELNDYNALDDLMAWVNQDQPTRAELYCMDGDSTCLEAEEVLAQFGVPSVFINAPESKVTLVYERILARDCENRFIDNSVNPYNLHYRSYGCSTASNMVQMVTDKRQFTSPALLGYADAERLDRVMRGYREPYNITAPEINSNFESALGGSTVSQ